MKRVLRTKRVVLFGAVVVFGTLLGLFFGPYLLKASACWKQGYIECPYDTNETCDLYCKLPSYCSHYCGFDSKNQGFPWVEVGSPGRQEYVNTPVQYECWYFKECDGNPYDPTCTIPPSSKVTCFNGQYFCDTTYKFGTMPDSSSPSC